MRLRHAGALLLAAGLAAACTPGREPDAPVPSWALAFDYLVQDICVDAADAPLPGAVPLDDPARCPRHRDLRVGERLTYHKHDWAARDDRAALPTGYQRSDAFPIHTRAGLAVLHSFDFGAPPRRYERFDEGDGGQVALFSADTAFFGLTEDGGAGLQFFYGADCAAPDLPARLRDSWVLIDRGFTGTQGGETVARLTKWADRCPGRLGYAYTRWKLRTLDLRVGLHGVAQVRAVAVLVSDHFGGRDPVRANHLERFYFTRELGYVRWERWENLARPGDAIARQDAASRAAALATSERCDAVAEPPASSGPWLMTDCRQWTDLVASDDPAGDPPHFWLDRLQATPTAAELFAP